MVALRSDCITPVSGARGTNTCLTSTTLNHLVTCPSPPDEIDPPPFTPSPSDHISLNQFDVDRIDHAIRKTKASNSRAPRFYRRSTSLLVFEPLLHHSISVENRKSISERAQRRKTRVEERRCRRSISAPGQKSARLPPKLHWPSPVDRSNRESHSEDNEEERDKNPPQQPDPQDFGGSELQPEACAGTHTGVLVPHEIRLRKASEVPREKTPRHDSLQGPRPLPISQNLGPVAHHTSSLKSRPIETALTEACVHTYLSDEPCEERRAVTSKQHRRVSATFQKVQSRDSVYEIIWEDILATSDSESTCSSSSSSSNSTVMQLPLSRARRESQARNGDFLTGLASWSWEGELEPYAEHDKPRLPNRSATPRRSSFKHESSSLTEGFPTEVRGSNRAHFQSGKAYKQETTNASKLSNPVESKARRSSMPSHIPVPQKKGSIKGRRLSIQQRRELLGDRKLSNLPPDESHFGWHRDSLILARERVFHNEHDASGRESNGEASTTPDWHRPGFVVPDVDRASTSLRRMTLQSKALASMKKTSKSLKSHASQGTARRDSET